MIFPLFRDRFFGQQKNQEHNKKVVQAVVMDLNLSKKIWPLNFAASNQFFYNSATT